MKKIIDNTETSVYIIDSEYHIVSFNRTLLQLFPDLRRGDYCYHSLCREESPCSNCPLSENPKAHAIFYNKSVQHWVDVSTATIEWPGAGTCQILLAKSINEGNKNLFFNLTSLSAYDELFELNLTRNYYKTLYHEDNKYISLPPEGALDQAVLGLSKYIHSDDRQSFLNFWNLDTLQPRLLNSPGSKSLTHEFRKLMADGGYGWVLQTVVPITYSENGEQVMMCFIQDIHSQKIQELSRHDQPPTAELSLHPLTGLYRRDIFFHLAQEFLLRHAQDPEPYCLMALDIEHFKLFNEWYGTAAGDDFLVSIGNCLARAQEKYNGIAGYIGNDDFVILMPCRDEALTELQEQLAGYVKNYQGSAGFLPAFGLYPIDDPTAAVSAMYDRACMALNSIKGNYARRCARYDSAIMRRMEQNHILLSEVQGALDRHEFTFYAQPKCNMATGKIIGLESLVRWNHPTRGLIQPGDFIPLLESNGFISSLDLYLWELVCSSLRCWLDRGFRAVPISVNVSRIDIYTLDVVNVFRNLIQKYQLDPGLLEIEITESAYTEDYHIITGVVESLREAGFTVLMDDFGSGYSSLNMLKDVNVDIIKLDMKFLDMSDTTSGKGIGILQAVTSMARLMNLRMIAEGIETQKQAELLLDMGCLYGQGYYFYRPMPIETFEPLLMNEENVDYSGICARSIERIGVRELLNENLFSEAMLNNILGAIALYDVFEDSITLLRANEKYYKETSTSPIAETELKQSVLERICEQDHHKFLELFEQAAPDRINGAQQSIRKYAEDGRILWLLLHVYFLREQDGHRLYYGAITNITAQKQKEQKLLSSQRALAAVVQIRDHDKSFLRLTEENRRTASSIFAQMTPQGMIGGYCEKDYPLYFANSEIIDLLGYSDYEELDAAISGKVINTIHPDDRERVAADVGVHYGAGMEYTTTYRMLRKDGSWFWTLDKGKVIQAENGRLAIISACTDISEPMSKQMQLTHLAQTDSLTGFLNRQAAIPKIEELLQSDAAVSSALIMFDMDKFKLANDVFGHYYGDYLLTSTADRLRSFFRNDDIFCRIGGDEFLIFCRNITQKDMDEKLRRVIGSLVVTRQHRHRKIQFSISAGYAMTPEQGHTFQELYKKADIALFSAKMNGRNSHRLYHSDMKSVRYELADI